MFALEAIGLAACLPLLRKVKPERFLAEVEELRPAPAPHTTMVAS